MIGTALVTSRRDLLTRKPPDRQRSPLTLVLPCAGFAAPVLGTCAAPWEALPSSAELPGVPCGQRARDF